MPTPLTNESAANEEFKEAAEALSTIPGSPFDVLDEIRAERLPVILKKIGVQ